MSTGRKENRLTWESLTSFCLDVGLNQIAYGFRWKTNENLLGDLHLHRGSFVTYSNQWDVRLLDRLKSFDKLNNSDLNLRNPPTRHFILIVSVICAIINSGNFCHASKQNEETFSVNELNTFKWIRWFFTHRWINQLADDPTPSSMFTGFY